jgi:hypothetical protein
MTGRLFGQAKVRTGHLSRQVAGSRSGGRPAGHPQGRRLCSGARPGAPQVRPAQMRMQVHKPLHKGTVFGMSLDPAHTDDASSIGTSSPLCRKMGALLGDMRATVAEETGVPPSHVKVQLQMPDDSVFELRSGGDAPHTVRAVTPP